MKDSITRIFATISCVFLISCTSEEFSLEWALEQAGENRVELEKVLAHYKQNKTDSLKYKAAAYLIQNMPGHYSYDADLVHTFCDQADSIMAIPIDSSLLDQLRTKEKYEVRNMDWEQFKIPALEELSRKYPLIQDKMRDDIHVITADYLIKNINSAFSAWETSPFATYLNFDQFCEDLLPYKVEDPFLPDNWKEACCQFADSIHNIDDLENCQYYKNSPHWAAQYLNQVLLKNMRIIGPYSYRGNELLRMSTFIKKHFVSCSEKGRAVTAVMRSKGVPVAVDYTPQWPSSAAGHAWNIVLVNPEGDTEKFDPFEGTPSGIHRPGEMMAKVYREGYAINRLLYSLNHSEEEVPPFLRKNFLKDVTAEYEPVQTIELEIPWRYIDRSCRFAYLAIFDNKEWVPVGCSEVKTNRVRFEEFGRNVAYLPTYYKYERNQPFAYPLTVDSRGEITHCIPDTTQLKTVTLYRKYPPHHHVYNTVRRLIDGAFDACNRKDEKDLISIHIFKGWSDPAGEIDLSQDTTKYRIWRFVSPPNHFNQMAEIMFYRKGDTIPNQGKIIGTPGTRIGDKKSYKETAFDGDPFTFFDAPYPSGCWVGMDFGEPVAMDRIVYVYRSDDNNIRMGDTYELFYWKDQQGWASLGKQTARDIQLTFENIPTNAMYLLRDLTRGIEERIFTLDTNGKQVWW